MPRVVRTEVEVSFKFILEPGGAVSASDQTAFQRTLALFRELQGAPGVTVNGALPSAHNGHRDAVTVDEREAVQRENRMCQKCGRVFYRAQTRSLHEGRCGAVPVEPIAIAEAVAETFPCQYCGRRMGTRASRAAHEASSCSQHPRHSWAERGAHLTETQCRFCERALSNLVALRLHETKCFKQRSTILAPASGASVADAEAR